MTLPDMAKKETNIFGNRLKYLRNTIMKKTQSDFSEFIEIPQPTLSAYESGRNKPTVDVLINISQKCHISIDWLCGNDISTNIASFQSLDEIINLLLDLSEEKGLTCEISFRR